MLFIWSLRFALRGSELPLLNKINITIFIVNQLHTSKYRKKITHIHITSALNKGIKQKDSVLHFISRQLTVPYHTSHCWARVDSMKVFNEQ